MKECKCGMKLEFLKDISSTGIDCKICYNKKMNEYRKNNLDKTQMLSRDCMRAKRWLNGSDNYSGELG